MGKRRKRKKVAQMNNLGGYNSAGWAHKFSECSSTAKLAFKIGGALIYGSNLGQVNSVPFDWDYKFRLTDRPEWFMDTLKPNSDLFPESLRKTYIKEPPTMQITWEDYSVPMLGREWWVELYKWLQTLPDKTRVVFYCHGGSGRTGTVLAILAGLAINDGLFSDALENEDPVTYVREAYCYSAVENEAQGRYIQAVTGRDVNISAINPYKGTPLSQVKSNNMSSGTVPSAAQTAMQQGLPYPQSVQRDEDGQLPVEYENIDDGSYTGPAHRKTYKTTYNSDGTVTITPIEDSVLMPEDV